MIRFLHAYVLVTTLLFIICSCEKSSPPTVSKPQLPVIEPMKMIYPYEMSVAEKKAFLDKIKALHPGEKYEEVVKLLGPPHYQYTISAMEHDRPLGTRLQYWMKKIGSGVNEKYDQCVGLNFDNDQRLKSISTNIAGLTFGALTSINTAGTTLDEIGKSSDEQDSHR